MKTQSSELSGGVIAALDEVANQVNEICRAATLDMAYRIGKLIIDTFCGGSIEAWREHGTSIQSYRALARRGDLLLGASALCRAVSVYVLSKRLSGRERWMHLSASHFQEVLPLEPSEQETLLERANTEHWSVMRLRTAVRAHHSKRRCTESEPAIILRSIRNLRREVVAQLGTLNHAAESDKWTERALESIRVELRGVTLLLETAHVRRSEATTAEDSRNQLSGQG